MSMAMLIPSIIFGVLGVVGIFCSTFIISIFSFTLMIILFMAYRKEKAYEKKIDEYNKRQRLYEKEIVAGLFRRERMLQEATVNYIENEDDEDGYDIKPNRPYDKIVDKLKRKLESTTSAKNSKLYKEILNVLQSKQYLAQKRVVLSEELFEKCIDFWPEMFDGIECKIDNDGNGVPDEDENCEDYF